MGNRVRRRTVHNVVDELKTCLDIHKPKLIHFLDETFSIDKSYLHELLDLLLENGIQRRIEWDAQTRTNLADFDLFRKMKAAGCYGLGFGIESGNEKICEWTLRAGLQSAPCTLDRLCLRHPDNRGRLSGPPDRFHSTEKDPSLTYSNVGRVSLLA